MTRRTTLVLLALVALSLVLFGCVQPTPSPPPTAPSSPTPTQTLTPTPERCPLLPPPSAFPDIADCAQRGGQVVGVGANGTPVRVEGGVQRDCAYGYRCVLPQAPDLTVGQLLRRTLIAEGLLENAVEVTSERVLIRYEQSVPQSELDLILNWYAAFGAASEAAPGSKRVVVQTFAQGEPLFEVAANMSDIQEFVNNRLSEEEFTARLDARVIGPGSEVSVPSPTPNATITPSPTAAVSCSDSDGGNVTNTKGTATSGSVSKTDECVDAATVREYYCSSAGVANATFPCASDRHCSLGACIPGAPSATPTPTASPTATITPTPTPTASPTATITPTPTPQACGSIGLPCCSTTPPCVIAGCAMCYGAEQCVSGVCQQPPP